MIMLIEGNTGMYKGLTEPLSQAIHQILNPSTNQSDCKTLLKATLMCRKRSVTESLANEAALEAEQSLDKDTEAFLEGTLISSAFNFARSI